MEEQDTQRQRESQAADRGLHEAITLRAYEIYQSRGGEHGGDVADWLQAEREVRSVVSDARSPDGADGRSKAAAEPAGATGQTEVLLSEAAPRRRQGMKA